MLAYVITFLVIAIPYLYLLNRRLVGPDPRYRARPAPSKQELESADYSKIDMLKAIPKATGKNYTITGGNGMVGSSIAHLLLLRGDKNIRILDLAPVHKEDEEAFREAGVEVMKVNITNKEETVAAITKPFANGRPTEVVFHVAAAIRFWERLSVNYHLSYSVNVTGAENVIEGCNRAKASVLVATSSGVVSMPGSKMARLFLGLGGWPERVVVKDNAPDFPEVSLDSNYCKTKKLGEKAVRAAHGKNGLRTAAIRASQAVVGTRDLYASLWVLKPQDPAFAHSFSQPLVCCQDLAAGHLVLEESLSQDKAGVGGQAFLMTSRDGRPFDVRTIRAIIQHYAPEVKLNNGEIPGLVSFALAHAVEGYNWSHGKVRALLGLPFASPELGSLRYMQPPMMHTVMTDMECDDSRARELLGYSPQWDALQTLKWVADDVLRKKK